MKSTNQPWKSEAVPSAVIIAVCGVAYVVLVLASWLLGGAG